MPKSIESRVIVMFQTKSIITYHKKLFWHSIDIHFKSVVFNLTQFWLIQFLNLRDSQNKIIMLLIKCSVMLENVSPSNSYSLLIHKRTLKKNIIACRIFGIIA